MTEEETHCYVREYTLRWSHNGHDGVSIYKPRDCLLNRLFRRRSKKTSKLRVTGLCAENSPVTGEFSAQMASNAENISIWWRHHLYSLSRKLHRKLHLKQLLLIPWIFIIDAWNKHTTSCLSQQLNILPSYEYFFPLSINISSVFKLPFTYFIHWFAALNTKQELKYGLILGSHLSS